MSQEKEGVCEVPGEPRGRAGEPEQNADRGAEDVKGPVLCQNGLTVSARINGQYRSSAYTHTHWECQFLYSFLTNSLGSAGHTQRVYGE